MKGGTTVLLSGGAFIAIAKRMEIAEEPDGDQANLFIEFPMDVFKGIETNFQLDSTRRAINRSFKKVGAAVVDQDRQLQVLIAGRSANFILFILRGHFYVAAPPAMVEVSNARLLEPDWDGDGVANWLELYLETNPRDARRLPSQSRAGDALYKLDESFARAIKTGETAVSGVGSVGEGRDEDDVGWFVSIAEQEPVSVVVDKPASSTMSTSAEFRFSTDTGAEFECMIDGAGFVSCMSPWTYDNLAEGRHTFVVRSLSAGGVADSSPESYTWIVDKTLPMSTVNGLPAAPTNKKEISVVLECNEPSCSFECSFDGSPKATCVGHYSMRLPKDGKHTLRVWAIDQAGNVQEQPTSVAFLVDTVPPATKILPIEEILDPLQPLRVRFMTDEADSVFECQLDDGPLFPCMSPYVIDKPGQGRHKLAVRATDPAGNIESNLPSVSWLGLRVVAEYKTSFSENYVPWKQETYHWNAAARTVESQVIVDVIRDYSEFHAVAPGIALKVPNAPFLEGAIYYYDYRANKMWFEGVALGRYVSLSAWVKAILGTRVRLGYDLKVWNGTTHEKACDWFELWSSGSGEWQYLQIGPSTRLYSGTNSCTEDKRKVFPGVTDISFWVGIDSPTGPTATIHCDDVIFRILSD